MLLVKPVPNLIKTHALHEVVAAAALLLAVAVVVRLVHFFISAVNTLSNDLGLRVLVALPLSLQRLALFPP